jgi:DUF3093 family protein
MLRGVGYDERLRVPVWWWGVGAGIAAILAVEVHLADRDLPPWIGVVPALIVVGLFLAALGRIRIRVSGGRLYVSDATLPLRYVSEIAPLDAAGKRRLLGPEGDPAAFVVQRAWAPGAVYLRLDDPDDRTPYWLVSTRHPEQLARAVLTERDGS